MTTGGIRRFQDEESILTLIISVQEQLRDAGARMEIARDLHAIFGASPPAEIVGGVARILKDIHAQNGDAAVAEWRRAAPELWKAQGKGADVIEQALEGFSRLPPQQVYNAIAAAALQSSPVAPQNVADDGYDMLYIALSVDVRPMLKIAVSALTSAAAAGKKETMEAIAAEGAATSRPVAAPKTARFRKPQAF